jgi:hypothetical protein
MIQNIINYINQSQELITAIIALAIAAIAGYKAIMDAIKNAAKDRLVEAVSPLIAQAETEPLKLLNSLVNKPEILQSDGLTALDPRSNVGKRNIVAQALVEREPKLLKKMKLKDIIEVGGFVSTIYQTIAKPMINGLKK